MPCICSHGRLHTSSSATCTLVLPGTARSSAITSASRAWWCARRPAIREASPMNRYSWAGSTSSTASPDIADSDARYCPRVSAVSPGAGLMFGVMNWHRRHRFCANCAHGTGLREGGLTRHCPNCGAEHHPRTDPS